MDDLAFQNMWNYLLRSKLQYRNSLYNKIIFEYRTKQSIDTLSGTLLWSNYVKMGSWEFSLMGAFTGFPKALEVAQDKILPCLITLIFFDTNMWFLNKTTGLWIFLHHVTKVMERWLWILLNHVTKVIDRFQKFKR